MPESPMDRWRVLGRLLPKDVRDRIFEPALGDLMRRRLEASRPSALPFAVDALGAWAGCLVPTVRHLFVRDGRLTRLGSLTVWAALLLAALGLAVARAQQAYGGPGYPG